MCNSISKTETEIALLLHFIIVEFTWFSPARNFAASEYEIRRGGNYSFYSLPNMKSQVFRGRGGGLVVQVELLPNTKSPPSKRTSWNSGRKVLPPGTPLGFITDALSRRYKFWLLISILANSLHTAMPYARKIYPTICFKIQRIFINFPKELFKRRNAIEHF